MGSKFLLAFLFFICFSFVSGVIYEGESSEIPVYVNSFVCYYGNLFAYIYNQTSYTNITIFNSTFSSGNCSLTQEWCCPTGYSCVNDVCVYDLDNPIDDCNDITDQSACTSAPAYLALTLLGNFNSTFPNSCGTQVNGIDDSGLLFSNVTTCGCAWNSTLNKCGVFLNSENNYSDGSGENLDCNWVETSREDLCSAQESKIVIYYTPQGSAVGQKDYCAAQVQEFPCEVSVKLPFFDNFTFILASLFIGMVYFLMGRKEKI